MSTQRSRAVWPISTFLAAALAAESSAAACAKDSWAAFEKKLVAAQTAFQLQDPAPLQALWSHASDVSLMGAAGGYEVGWDLVGPRLLWVSAATTKGPRNDRVLVRVLGADLAMIMQIEGITNLKPDGSPLEVVQLRVTHIARCEGSEWRVIHRHADRLQETRRPEPPAPRP